MENKDTVKEVPQAPVSCWVETGILSLEAGPELERDTWSNRRKHKQTWRASAKMAKKL